MAFMSSSSMDYSGVAVVTVIKVQDIPFSPLYVSHGPTTVI